MESRANIALTGLFLLAAMVALFGFLFYLKKENEMARIQREMEFAEYKATHECPPGHEISTSWGKYICVMVPQKRK